MIKKRLWILVFLCAFKLVAVDSWYEDRRRGWYYFEESTEKNEDLKETSEELLSLEEAPKEIERFKAKTEQLLSLAILRPTKKNVISYLIHQKKLMQQSAQFASTWKSLLISQPDLAFDLPKTVYGAKLKQIQEESDLDARLERIKSEHFLVFFFRGSDLMSSGASEVVSRLSELGGWHVEAISVDGRGLRAFPKYSLDHGIAENFSLKHCPALYLVHPTENYVIPVAYGLVDYETTLRNIDFQVQRIKERGHAL